VTDVGPAMTTVRLAVPEDAAALAQLHATRISEGFLPTLGDRFLTRLYRRIIHSDRACAFVADDNGQVLAFAAGATSVGGLYKEFLLHDGVIAGIQAAPRIVRSLGHVWETLRYPSSTTDLPRAEVLAVATSTAATGKGLGAAAVRAVTADLAQRGGTAVKVTVGADNAPALALYRSCGFTTATTIEVHGGTTSEVLVWTAL
jgi:ribosomal protein S18 acetylase RimI-like enzyme